MNPMFGLSAVETEKLFLRCAEAFDKGATGQALAPLIRAGDPDALRMRHEHVTNMARSASKSTSNDRANIRLYLTDLFRKVKLVAKEIKNEKGALTGYTFEVSDRGKPALALLREVMLGRKYIRITVLREDTEHLIGKGQNKRAEKVPLIVGLAPSKDKKRVTKSERMLQVAAAIDRVKP